MVGVYIICWKSKRIGKMCWGRWLCLLGVGREVVDVVVVYRCWICFGVCVVVYFGVVVEVVYVEL